MSIERPTFHESWYRVAGLRPRLLSSVQIYRQFFRGQMWYVLEDSAGNKFSRISESAHHFIAMLDGKRTVSDIWKLCNEQLGDNAATQPEVIQLLGQLYCSNLLWAELPADTKSLFNRYRKRKKREIQGYLTNLLFVRIPIFDPDYFLNRWVALFGKVFTKTGLAIWIAFIFTAIYFLINRAEELVARSSDILAPENLFLLYISFVFIKIIHEFGHAFACKKFGIYNGNGGQVHTMGVMFLVFIPLPYVDTSSSWAFRSKWHRTIVGMGGVMTELFIAAIAAVVWANTSTSTVNIIAYNIMFIASISTLLFNGNPLLRFDGYYVLSDILEIPNLAQRSKNHLYYLVKRYIWNLKKAIPIAHSLGERIWFVFYGIASTAYRIFISIRILLFLNNRLPEQFFILVPVFAASAVIGWFFVPLGKFLHYLVAGVELNRDRIRAISTTLAAMGALIICIGIIKVPDHTRVEAIMEPVQLEFVYASENGFIVDFQPSGTNVTAGGEPLIKTVNMELETSEKQLLAIRNELQARHQVAQTRETAQAQVIEEQLLALDEKITWLNNRIDTLEIKPTLSGTWVSPDIEKQKGAFIQRGRLIGFLASLDDMLIRATAGQEVSALLIENAKPNVDIRVKGRPDLPFTGKIKKIMPAGQEYLPSPALGYAAGGSIATAENDSKGTKAAERFFEIQIEPDKGHDLRLLTGQRVIVRFEMPSKPLAKQWWRSIRQLFQRRFHI